MTSSTKVSEPGQTPPPSGGPRPTMNESLSTGLFRWTSAMLPSVVSTLFAILFAVIVGALLILFTTGDCLHALGHGNIGAAFKPIGQAYWALLKGAVGGWGQITTTMEYAAPLVCAGLGVTLAFRAGLFNIGAQGQLIVGAALCGFVGFHWHIPGVAHLIVALIAALVGGALWGGIAGVLKARTGAHEVITTMMLNYVAKYGLWFLLTKKVFLRPHQTNPTSPTVDHNALFPQIFGFHSGVILAVVAAVAVWWLLERSTWGFEMRAVGANPEASRTAGMSTGRVTIVVLTLAGALAGLGAAMQILGQNNDLTQGTGGTIGFDAITVALLGRATPLGTVLAGLLWGGLQVGSANMQAAANTPAELTEVIQALIVMFVAAPALVREIVRLRIISREQTLAAKGWGG
jgi:general nucleoside transport system permease protein